jgi:hypothetical protein
MDKDDEAWLAAWLRLHRALQRLYEVLHARHRGNIEVDGLRGAYLEYRAAEAAWRQVREQSRGAPSWEATSLQQGPEDQSTTLSPESPEPTPQLRFVRWLVQTGRLSDDASSKPRRRRRPGR